YDHVPGGAHDHFHGLSSELRCVAIEQAGDALARLAEVFRSADAVPAGTVSTVGKEADGEESPGAVHAVHADGADRVVDLALVEEEDAHHHEPGGHRPDDERTPRTEQRAGARAA